MMKKCKNTFSRYAFLLTCKADASDKSTGVWGMRVSKTYGSLKCQRDFKTIFSTNGFGSIRIRYDDM